MQSRAFADAVRQAPRRILRVWLQPYSLGHEMLLTAEGNPLLWQGMLWESLPIERKIFSVIRAVQICSRNWKQNQKPDHNLKLWFYLIRKDDKLAACEQFKEYRNTGSTYPELMEPPKPDALPKQDALGSPYLAILLDYAATLYGELAFDQPLGMLQWMHAAKLEGDRKCKPIKNAWKYQFDAEVEAARAAVRKEKQCRR
jgi:hypothetical protein